MNEEKRTAVLAGGCFWGLEDLVRDQPGVLDTEVGYAGGQNDNPTYQNHPGHAEALEITYDPDKTSYKRILDFFFQVHDPTTLNRQGNDGVRLTGRPFFTKARRKKNCGRNDSSCQPLRTLAQSRCDHPGTVHAFLARRRLSSGLPGQKSQRLHLSQDLLRQLLGLAQVPAVACLKAEEQ